MCACACAQYVVRNFHTDGGRKFSLCRDCTYKYGHTNVSFLFLRQTKAGNRPIQIK